MMLSSFSLCMTLFIIGICSKEYGYIKDIEIKNVTQVEISMADGGTRFSTTYAIQSMLPKPGNVYVSKNVIILNNSFVVLHDVWVCLPVKGMKYFSW